ncbi:hypothetical protein M501DRAFT_1019150 [Patellaria atrata CBS 101060]|uniref:Uncharacterized protein n=1 Tax=Patellaria atrata CBS 101060 TaxID=1346257 RepID=A0A9P4S565_9PEZI|nr:hypothetical protein M501DRAFT_1019150 [Patellaria atrata CBS 101060]
MAAVPNMVQSEVEDHEFSIAQDAHPEPVLPKAEEIDTMSPACEDESAPHHKRNQSDSVDLTVSEWLLSRIERSSSNPAAIGQAIATDKQVRRSQQWHRDETTSTPAMEKPPYNDGEVTDPPPPRTSSMQYLHQYRMSRHRSPDALDSVPRPLPYYPAGQYQRGTRTASMLEDDVDVLLLQRETLKTRLAAARKECNDLRVTVSTMGGILDGVYARLMGVRGWVWGLLDPNTEGAKVVRSVGVRKIRSGVLKGMKVEGAEGGKGGRRESRFVETGLRRVHSRHMRKRDMEDLTDMVDQGVFELGRGMADLVAEVEKMKGRVTGIQDVERAEDE